MLELDVEGEGLAHVVAAVPAEVAGEAVDEAVDTQGKAREQERVDHPSPSRQLMALPVRRFLALPFHRLLPIRRLLAQTRYRADGMHLRVPHT